MSKIADSLTGQETLKKLSEKGYRLATLLNRHAKVSLSEYLHTTIQTRPSRGGIYFYYVVEAIEEALTRDGQFIAREAQRSLENFPCIQQADHASLLFDRNTYLNNLLHAYASSLHGADICFTHQCSTISCLSRRSPPEGPFFLQWEKVSHQLCAHSKRTLKDSAFCFLPGPFKFMLGDLPVSEIDATLNTNLNSLLQITFPESETAFRQANAYLQDILVRPNTRCAISFIDDSVVLKIVEKHLANPDSPLCKLLFDMKALRTHLDVKHSFLNSQENRVLKKSQPDFFWFRSGQRMSPLNICFIGAELNLFTFDTRLPTGQITWTPAGLTSALAERALMPDLFLSYLVRCLLPDIRAIGGTSQQEYLQHFQSILDYSDAKYSFLSETERSIVLRDDAGTFSGYPLTEGLDFIPPQSGVELFSSLSREHIAKNFSEIQIETAVGNLEAATYLIDNFIE